MALIRRSDYANCAITHLIRENTVFFRSKHENVAQNLSGFISVRVRKREGEKKREKRKYLLNHSYDDQSNKSNKREEVFEGKDN